MWRYPQCSHSRSTAQHRKHTTFMYSSVQSSIQSLYWFWAISSSVTIHDFDSRIMMMKIKKRLVWVREWLVREGGAVLCCFIDWFLLLLVARCLLAWSLSCLVSRVSCVRASFFISLVWAVWSLGHLLVVVSERDRDWSGRDGRLSSWSWCSNQALDPHQARRPCWWPVLRSSRLGIRPSSRSLAHCRYIYQQSSASILFGWRLVRVQVRRGRSPTRPVPASIRHCDRSRSWSHPHHWYR